MTTRDGSGDLVMRHTPQTTTDVKPSDQVQSSSDYSNSIRIENEDDTIEFEIVYDENGEPKFPLNDLTRLEEQVTRMKWTIPVLPGGELIKCLRAAISFAKAKLDVKNELCQRFIREGLLTSFNKIFCDEAALGWKNDVYIAIYNNAILLIRLYVLKIDDDCPQLLEIMSFIMNPNSRFHQANAERSCAYSVNAGIEPFGSIATSRYQPRGWLVDFINKFGALGGFDKILNRFNASDAKLTMSMVVAIIKPWGLCFEYLTQSTINKYFSPIIEIISQFLSQLGENEFKIEAKTESKSDTVSAIIKWLRQIGSRLTNNEKVCHDLDELRLKMVLRLLQTNSFSAKMNALNEINKLIPSLSMIHRPPINRFDDNEGLKPEKFLQWIQEHEILDMVLHGCLHQPQYVEKLDRILRFLIKAQALSRDDLAKIWNASSGKHEAIEKNVHDLLAKLAWDFSPEQLEQLFDCFRESWTKASKKQREKLLELIRRLAEDDKEGLMANKVLEILWNISYDEHFPNEIIDQALAAHLKILDYSCLPEKDKTKIAWIDRMMEEIKQNRHVLISMKQMREICLQFSEHSYTHNMSRMSYPLNRIGLVDTLEKKHKLVHVITQNLCQYMESIRRQREETKKILPPEEYYPDGRFNHNQQILERLAMLRFALKDGRLYLDFEHAKMIWISLVENALYLDDREHGFRWFSEINDEVGFEIKTGRDFFQNHFMKLEASLLTDLGMNCFDRFFKSINAQTGKFIQKHHSIRLISDQDLVGIEYLWKLIIDGSDTVAYRGIHLIKEIYTNIKLPSKQDVKRIHQTFIADCFKRLRAACDSVKEKSTSVTHQNKLNAIIRILDVLREYLADCDHSYHKERSILPMSRAFRGRTVTITFRVNLGANRQPDEFEHISHSNETWGQIRRMLYNRYKTSYGVFEILRNNELVEADLDNKTLGKTDGRDKFTIVVRWAQQVTQAISSEESSSSDSDINNSTNHHNTSSTSATARVSDGVDINAENVLPSVIFSLKHDYYKFLIELSDIGCKEKDARLRDIPRQILDLVPVDPYAKESIIKCFANTKGSGEESSSRVKALYYNVSPTQMLYNLQATLVRVAPAVLNTESNDTEAFYVYFHNAGGLGYLLNILTEQHLTDQCDTKTKKLSGQAGQSDTLEQILNSMPLTMISLGENQNPIPADRKTAMLLYQNRSDYPIAKNSFLQYNHIVDFIRIIWCLASHNKQISFDVDLKKNFQLLHDLFKPENFHPNESQHMNDCSEEDTDNQMACREGLELLCLSIALVPSSIDQLLKENFFEYFLIDLVLYCHYASIRHIASEQILVLTSRCSPGQNEHLLKYLIDKQFEAFHRYSNDVKKYSSYSMNFFSLLCRLLSFAYQNNVLPPNIEQQLNEEIHWLKNLQLPVDEYLLNGHLNLAKELLQFQPSERKRFYGIDQLLIQQIIEQFICPASVLLHKFRMAKRRSHSEENIKTMENELVDPPTPICQTPMTISAAFELLIVLGTDCIENLRLIDKYTTDLFYSAPDSYLTDWDFCLPIGPRPNDGFVGLKNACATCYMNSVLQQLFMIQPLRQALLSVNIPSEYGDDDGDDDDIHRDAFDTYSDLKSYMKDSKTTPSPTKDSTSNERIKYNIEILRQIQRMFGHLSESKLQYYVPKGFWKIFKLGGEPVNLRDQQDSVEFFNTLVDCIDEALKTLNLPQICSKVLGGKFADQKICKGCPHRYSHDEDFTLISVDIRHSQKLEESLEQYVIGELLDGPNAYNCEKCNKKVDTIKRTCFKKLPSILAIQLKRFDYDWEREMPVKFNDYFEFPRELDMEPYTVQGLAKAEGTTASDENSTDDQASADSSSNDGTRYRLVGIIVHMGQANGGHYYSFIQHKNDSNYSKWYKFDDIEVTECKMEDDEELRSQCFGGDNPVSQFDQTTTKRQRRWWNAYILFYEKISDTKPNPLESCKTDAANQSLHDKNQHLPLSVQRSVRKQNIKFFHARLLFSFEYFNFMKRLAQSNTHMINLFSSAYSESDQSLKEKIDALSLLCTQIITKFIFSFGWHSKKTLRGQTSDWVDLLSTCLRISRSARCYLASDILNARNNRFQEYLVDCSLADIRAGFARTLATLARNFRQEGTTEDDLRLEEDILTNVISLLRKDTFEGTKTLTQYFNFFVLYTTNGRTECVNLIRLNVPGKLINVTNYDSTSLVTRPNETTKLNTILATLIRCFDVSEFCQTNQIDNELLPNPYYTFDNAPLCSMPHDLYDVIYQKEGFIRRIVEDTNSINETSDLLRFLLWENPNLTKTVLEEIFILLSKSYGGETRFHLDTLNVVLTIKDSWQEARLLNALKGIPILTDSHPSTVSNENYNNYLNLFELFSKLKASYEKRAYQYLKMMSELFKSCDTAYDLLHADPHIKDSFKNATYWLRNQLESPNHMPSTYYNYSTQAPVTSNETSQSLFLERTASAKCLLEKASELCSDRENDDVGSNSDECDEQ